MPDLAAYNALPYLQVFVGGIIIIAGVWMMVQANRDKKAVPNPAAMPEGVQMFFQGPLVQALQSLRDICHAINNLTMIAQRSEENTRLVKQELARQTGEHIQLMKDTQRILENMLDELKDQRR